LYDVALPILTTGRLVLRPVTIADVDALHQLWIDRDVRRYLWDNVVIPRERAEETVRDMLSAVDDRLGMWVVTDARTNDLAGFCALIRREGESDPELMYGLAPRFWGQGFATEASRALLVYAFGTLECPRVSAATDVPNGASVRVMERLGFRFSRRGMLNGLDMLFYEIGRAAFVIDSPDTARR
jgi:ribosomal-protein-alanine N-acetyltransferase